MGSSALGKAAPFDLLLEECIQAFDDHGELKSGHLPRTLLLMHHNCRHSRLKICYFMRYWIVTFPAEFNLDLGLIRMTEELRNLAAQLGYKEHYKLIDISTIPSYDWMRKLTQRKRQVKKGKASLLFDHLEPMELAEHLTFLDYVTHGCLQDNPTLERSIALFNGVSQWVQLMVLSKLTPQHRADKLLQLQNFNTLMALVGGLSHSSISRLKETHSHLAPEVTRDLIAVHVVFPDWADARATLVNLVKMQQLYATFNELVALQGASAQLEPNMDLIYLLTLSLDLYYTEDEIYELSLLREPRNSKSLPNSPTTPNKTVAPLDWASGVTTKPDPCVVNKHIRRWWTSACPSRYANHHPPPTTPTTTPHPTTTTTTTTTTTSVFRNYDHDRDGDGLISKDEMMAYFMRANPLLQCKMGPGFVHNFQEMTYLKPTFCEHCAGFLWGIIKQGYKCKDCGVNCHKQCRELLVLACRALLRSASLGNVSPSDMSHSSMPSSPSLRISVRLQRATISQATQMEPLWAECGGGGGGGGWGPVATAAAAAADSGSHTFPKMRYRPHRKTTSKSRGFAHWDNHHEGAPPRQGPPAQSAGPETPQAPGGGGGGARAGGRRGGGGVQNGIGAHRGKVTAAVGTGKFSSLGEVLRCLRAPFRHPL
ncbi:hypothetical protein CRUP_000215 [Coryphaenoides rupestris]|nr:hypothetical protein CRUP_000215 [Coryphaenoides rupestris]